MNKILLVIFILINFKTILFCFGYTVPQLYANFIPYQNEKCTGDSIGVGLSITVGTEYCITNIGSIVGSNFEVKSTSTFSLFVNALRVGIFQYDNIENGDKCLGRDFSEFYTFKNGTCNLTPPFITAGNSLLSNNTIIGGGVPLNKQYSIFSITQSPFFGLVTDSTNTQVYTQYNSANPNNCSVSNHLYSMYFTNNLEINFNNDYNYSVTYSCNSDNQPTQNICNSNNQCNIEEVPLDCSNSQSIYCLS
ncbi:hypothetical protein RB653_003131 [Dictyostelium firmibasis]|uniref:Uncharacterized protein n=1 Tax=Dictyostelium firmibasis TaxID=79012 RepID=A0AAN7UBH5_9MYCE